MHRLAAPWLLRMDPERAHALALRILDLSTHGPLRWLLPPPPSPRPVRVFGIDFPNPVGLAAGLDKNGAHVEGLFALGFGSVEIGTVTPRPQPGNPPPRLFRLPEQRAIINRMGFNNDGVDALVRNVARVRQRRGVLGINIGKNKDTPNERAIDDYLHCLRAVHGVADYITVNLSSPNTAGLRDLQQRDALRGLIAPLRDEHERLGSGTRRVPLLVKVAPDLDCAQVEAMARVFDELQLDGVIATNTTVSRVGVEASLHAQEQGGLSGAPLTSMAGSVLAQFRQALPERIALVGVGGIIQAADAADRIGRGARLVQLYTGLVYRGPRLIGECCQAIADLPAGEHAATESSHGPTR